jgi:phosphoglycolate phosphatase-like HAD superfamily hydrolase
VTNAVLASWRDGPAKQAILDFVASATTPGLGFVALADRVATFDNDGTLWVEQPLPPQFDFVFRHWAEEIRQDPSLAELQPYKAIITKDVSFFAGVATQDPEVVGALLAAFARTWKGTTPEEFDAQVREWLETVKQPKLGVPYIELVYKPMLELLEFLKAYEFRVFVCSGGGRDFMRVFAEDAWGIFKENVIGTAAEYTYADGGIVRGEHASGAWMSVRASRSTSSLRPAAFPCWPAGTPTSTSRCSRPPRSPCSSTMTTRSASSPTPAAARRPWPGPRSSAGPSSA